MTERLKNVLLSVNFKNRYDSLFEKHSHRNLFKKADPKEVQKIIEKLGYECVYHKSDKFFKIDNVKYRIIRFQFRSGYGKVIIQRNRDDFDTELLTYFFHTILQKHVLVYIKQSLKRQQSLFVLVRIINQ